MEVKQPEFKLISCTEDPIETLFACWAQSRPTQYPRLFEWLEGGVVTAKDVIVAVSEGIVTEEEVLSVFKNVTAMSIPVSESIHMTWGFTSLPIEWREQAVRKRQWGFWLTSMREFGMDDFVTEGRWAPPVEGAGTPEALAYLEDFMKEIEGAYNKLKELGMPQEIARKVIPSCATHNGTMFSTFRTLLETLASRSCWIAQVDLWSPVLKGIVNSLKEKHPMLGLVVSPPCFNRFDDEYKGCKYHLINENRLNGKDPYAVCPIYAQHEGHMEKVSTSDHGDLPYAEVMTKVGAWERLMRDNGVGEQYIQQGHRLLPVWSEIWNRDPFTGKIDSK